MGEVYIFFSERENLFYVDSVEKGDNLILFFEKKVHV